MRWRCLVLAMLPVAGFGLGGIGCTTSERLVAVQMVAADAGAVGTAGVGGAAATGGAAGIAGVGGAAATGGAAGIAGVGGTAATGGAAAGAGAGGNGTTFAAPTLISGLRGDNHNIHDPSLTEDELEIYFSSVTSAQSDIWMATRSSVGEAWQAGVVVNELSGAGDDIDPDVSPDGLVMYFASDRAESTYRLYVAARTARSLPWGPAQAMTGLGDSSQDLAPSVEPSGLFMVFASQRDSVDIRLFSASRAALQAPWENVAELTGINSGHQDQNPALFNQSLSLIWSSRRNPGIATSDLFQTSRSTNAQEFTATAVTLDSLRTPDYWEGDPWVSQDGRHIVFVSDRGSGISQIHESWR